MDICSLKKELNTKVIGRDVFFYEEIGSTNEEAKKKIREGKIREGDVVIAAKQVGGRGRFERQWFSPEGGIYLSIIVKPRINRENFFVVTILGAIAVTRAIEKLTGMICKLKWPNDVLISGKKVSGVLAEKKQDAVVVGVGVNLNIPRTLFDEQKLKNATSILIEAGREIEINKFIKTLLEEFDVLYNLFLFEGRKGVAREHGGLIMELPHGKIAKLDSLGVLK